MLKNKNDKDWTDITVQSYLLICQKYSYTARINMIVEMLKYLYNIQEWSEFEPKLLNNSPFESWLIDKQIEWMKGKDIDFHEIYEGILEYGDFSAEEKRLFELGGIEERLWGIFLAITDPGNENNIKYD